MAELIHFLHITFFVPVKSTWLAGIKQGFLNSVSGINQENVQTYLEKSVCMTMVHVDKECASI